MDIPGIHLRRKSSILTIQYLEDSPALQSLDPKQVTEKLKAACSILPFTHLLIGWHVPVALQEACRKEAESLGMRFLRWQPLLTSDHDFQADPAWLAQGWSGNKLTGFRNMPEFTFACPNHPATHESVLEHISHLIGTGLYQGFFLDRIRFPSPAVNPIQDLSCFCEHCRRKAAEAGLDLERIRLDLISAGENDDARIAVVKSMLTGEGNPGSSCESLPLREFLAFRNKSVLDFLFEVARLCKDAGLEVGLDCFSPGLARMVGQDIHQMSACADWVKVMTYAHARGPAGLPYEISCFVDYLCQHTSLGERESLAMLSQSLQLSLPDSREILLQEGLSSLALEREIRRGIESCAVPLLAGMELVELEGIAQLNNVQLKADLLAIKRASPAGLAISWDLLHIPLDRLEMVRQVYQEA